MVKKHVVIIGAGISGLSAACHLAKAGFKVTVFEKNEHAGGRIGFFEIDEFKFDMGPSWYWMPEVFDRFYEKFGYKTLDFYKLIKLNPGFEIVFNQNDTLTVWSELEDIYREFERIERGSSQKLKRYLEKAGKIYDIAMGKMVYKPFLSWTDFIDPVALNFTLISSLFYSVSDEVRKLFKHPYLCQLLEFPVIFLGSTAEKIPALYNLMNYAAFVKGTWYPIGGMWQIARAFETIARNLGVEFVFNTAVEKIVIENGEAKGIIVPFIFSFRSKFYFVDKWKIFFQSILPVATFFILWDFLFTDKNIWWFNKEYTVGLKIFNLPVEEVLFFFVIPYACIFTFFNVLKHIPLSWMSLLKKLSCVFFISILIMSVLLAIIFYNRWYTFSTLSLLSVSLIYFLFVYSDSDFLRYFLIEYVLIIPGFLLSNGVLTGSFIVEQPIVFYNPEHHIGVRVFNIPVEDFFYGMLLLIWVSFLFYKQYKRKFQNQV